jgi:hypothetical protein
LIACKEGGWDEAKRSGSRAEDREMDGSRSVERIDEPWAKITDEYNRSRRDWTCWITPCGRIEGEEEEGVEEERK